jgi:hypothetical protein
VPRSYKQDEVKNYFSSKGAAIQRGLEHESGGIAIVGAVTRQLLEKTLRAEKDLACVTVMFKV